jgi:hypothetical protein
LRELPQDQADTPPIRFRSPTDNFFARAMLSPLVANVHRAIVLNIIRAVSHDNALNGLATGPMGFNFPIDDDR